MDTLKNVSIHYSVVHLYSVNCWTSHSTALSFSGDPTWLETGIYKRISLSNDRWGYLRTGQKSLTLNTNVKSVCEQDDTEESGLAHCADGMNCGVVQDRSVCTLVKEMLFFWHVFPSSCNGLCMHASLQSCPTLCDPMDSSPPGSPVHGIPQARILDWVATSFFSNGLNGLLPKFTWTPVLIGLTATGVTTFERGRLSLREQASKSRLRVRVPMVKGSKCTAPGAEPWWSTPNTTGWAEEPAVGTKTGTGENCTMGSLTKATSGFGKSHCWGYLGAAGRVCCLALEQQESSEEATSFISKVSSSGTSGCGIGWLLSDSAIFLDSFQLHRQFSIFLFLLGGSPCSAGISWPVQ